MNNSNVLAASEAGELHSVIRTTLPMEELIGIFETEIRQSIRYDSFEYEHATNATHFFHGTPKLHKCHYRLKIAGLDMGSITFTRATPFAGKELRSIEGALGALSIHLNNAIEHQNGLGEKELASLRVDEAYTALR